MLVQEWLAEAVTMWSFAAVVIAVTAVGGGTSSQGALLVLAVLTASPAPARASSGQNWLWRLP